MMALREASVFVLGGLMADREVLYISVISIEGYGIEVAHFWESSHGIQHKTAEP